MNQKKPSAFPLSGNGQRGESRQARTVGRGGQELVLWGGNANNGANCGLAYANSNNAWSNSNANIGSRHTYLSQSNLRVPRTMTLQGASRCNVVAARSRCQKIKNAERPPFLRRAASGASRLVLFDVRETRLMDILNVPITVLDFETDVKTKQGDGRYCVLFEQDGRRGKFITNCYNLKDVLDQAREAENNGQKIFPVEDVIVKRRPLGEGKSAYYFEE